MGAADEHPEAVARLLRSRVEAGAIDLPVAGSSMKGVIESGATVTIGHAEQPRRGEIWAFVDDDGTVVVHRVRTITTDTIIGRGTGNPVDDPPVPKTRLIGRVERTLTSTGKSTTFRGRDRLQALAILDGRRFLHRAGLWRLDRFRPS